MAVIKSSDLDFDAIKANLKTYLQSKSEFSDYDFEGSGLSNILDVLAYNTHLNGLIANIGINESFLNSSQLRSSVISHAQTLGYDVKSRTASMALLNVSVVTSDTSTQTLTLPSGTEFTTDIDDVIYTFKTIENYTASNDGAGTFVFQTSAGSTSIPVYEGTSKTKTYLIGQADDEQVFVIPDTTIDTTTMSVLVYDSPTSSNYTVYSDINEVVRILSTSTVYIVNEVPNGYYELVFSRNNVLGQSPVANNKVVVTYLSPVGAAANGGSSFVTDAELLSTGLTVSTVSNSAGGSEKETINSIKENAPRAYATQQRLVTAEDYIAIIAQRYSSVLDDVIAWGGNDNVPPVYGRVYVSLKFKDGIDADTQQSTKDSISTVLGPSIGIMSIDTVFTDPTTTYLELSTYFDFNPEQTGSTAQTTESLVTTTISNYFTTNLDKFESVFRRSNLLAVIDDLSPAILNSRMDVKIHQRFVPESDELGRITNYTIYFPVVLANPDDVNYTITSSVFTYNNESCELRNKLNSTILQIVRPNGTVVSGNVGTYDTSTGTIALTGINITAYQGDYIRITAVPANQSTIKPLRNYILSFDNATSITSSVADYETTAVTL